MAFLDDLGRKVSEVGQKTVQKTNELSANARLNSAISESERTITDLYTQIGRLYYAQHRNDYEDVFTDLISRIAEENEKIRESRAQKEMLSSTKTCIQCGAQLPSDAAFCYVCSAKQPARMAASQTEKEEMIMCTNCGASMPSGNSFCMSCGKSLSKKTAIEPSLVPYPGKKEIITCSSCGASVPAGNSFCTACGNKLTMVISEKPEEDAPTDSSQENVAESPEDQREAIGTNVCPRCGSDNPQENNFCSSCGAPLVSDASTTGSVSEPVFLEENNNIVEPEEMKEKDTLVCPKCGEETPKGKPFCAKCGIKFDAYQPDAESEKDEEPLYEETIICTSCGAFVPVGNRFCISCGFDLDSIIDDTETESAEPDKTETESVEMDEAETATTESITDSVVCPACDSKVPAENRFCVKCGYDLSKPVEEKEIVQNEIQEESSEAESKFIRCISCGAEVPADNRFCTSCGFDLAVAAAPIVFDENDQTIHVSGPSIEQHPTPVPYPGATPNSEKDPVAPIDNNSDIIPAGFVRCNNCNELVKEGNKFCVKCGSKLSVSDMISSNVETPNNLNYCVKCGAPIVPGNAFCTMCGTKY